MRLPIYQVDAFTPELFRGNPAAVCPLPEWIAAETMQKIAMENNLAETAFYVPGPERFAIRWFTPAVEVDLCGHATLAAGHVVFAERGFAGPRIEFESRSGILAVRRAGDLLTLDFPADAIAAVAPPAGLVGSIGGRPREIYKGKTDYLLVYESRPEIEALAPDFGILRRVEARGVIVTAPGGDVDFVSRFFAPRVGVDEDPVTGSAHTTLTPFWAARLGKSEMKALQLSARRGWLTVRSAGDRVEITGQARLYMKGEIEIA